MVGAGSYGAIFVHEALKKGKGVLTIDKGPNIAGDIYTEEIEKINAYKYGAHVLHTNSKQIWEYVDQFAEFNRSADLPMANYSGELHSLPFNMYAFSKVWGVVKPEETEAKIEEQKKRVRIKGPRNLEKQAINLASTGIYERLVKGYTKKQWRRLCSELPAFIIKRLPARFASDNNYFNALFQGIPIGGYTKMVANTLEGVEVKLCTDYLESREAYEKTAMKVVYTGPIDTYYKSQLGTLEYRSVHFGTEILGKPSLQGSAIVNYTDAETPWTRITEHKWLEVGTQSKTVISRGYSSEWKRGDEPYYPMNDKEDGVLCAECGRLAGQEKRVLIGGRLDEYKHYGMDTVAYSALGMCIKELSVN